MKRAALVTTAIASLLLAFAALHSSAATGKATLEVWGLEAGDAVTLDGTPITVKTGGAPRVFAGDPAAVNAPVLTEVAMGAHTLVVRRAACAPRTIPLAIETTSKKVLVLEKEDPARCELPFAPPRR